MERKGCSPSAECAVIMNDNPKTLRAVIVCGGRGWILETFANRLADGLSHFDIEAVVSEDHSNDADVNLWRSASMVAFGQTVRMTLSA